MARLAGRGVEIPEGIGFRANRLVITWVIVFHRLFGKWNKNHFVVAGAGRGCKKRTPHRRGPDYGSPPSSAKGPELCRWSGLLLVICPSVCQFLLSGLEL